MEPVNNKMLAIVNYINSRIGADENFYGDNEHYSDRKLINQAASWESLGNIEVYLKIWKFGDSYTYLVNDLDGTLVTLKDCLDEGIEQLFESEGWLEDNDEY